MASVMMNGGDGDQLKCTKVISGGMWRCNFNALSGESFCEKHLFSVQTRVEKKDGGVSGREVKRTRGEGMGGNDDVRNVGGTGGESEGVVNKRGRGKPPKGVKSTSREEARNDVGQFVLGESGSGANKRGSPKGVAKMVQVVEGNGGGVKETGRPRSVNNDEDRAKVSEENVGLAKKRGRPMKTTVVVGESSSVVRNGK